MIDARYDRTRHVFQPFQAVKSIVRLDRNHTDISVSLFEIASGPHNRTTRTDTCNKVSNMPFRLMPDLRASSLVMRERIRRIKILIWLEIPLRCFVEDLPAQT